jgi:hypothetical protein
MSLYNAMFEAATKMRKAAGKTAGIAEGAAKSTRDTARAATTVAKAAIKAPGPALGKLARYAAYPVGLGGGIGLGTWAAGAGAASAIDSTGAAVKKSWTPESATDAGKMFFGVLLLVMFIAVAVYLYRTVKRA